MEKSLGAIPSGVDYRSRLIASAILTPINLPSKWVTDVSMLGVLDQNQIPACVSHAWVQVMKYWWYLKTGEVVDFSPRFLDILSWESDLGLEDGRRPRTVAKISKDIGCCTTKTLPNDTSLPLAQYRDKTIITQAMRDEAAKYKIPGFIDFGTDPTSIRTALYKYGVASILLSIGSEWWTPSWYASDIMPLKTPKNPTGGHETLRHGWDNDLANGLNEWSKDWGIQGQYTYNEKAWQRFTGEILTIADLDQQILDHVHSLPAPDAFKHTFQTNLQLGDNNEEVKNLQIALSILGYFNGPITGFYGPITRGAVFAFQKDHVQLSITARLVYRGKYFFDATRQALNSLVS